LRVDFELLFKHEVALAPMVDNQLHSSLNCPYGQKPLREGTTAIIALDWN
jgi:hypothetical protein